MPPPPPPLQLHAVHFADARVISASDYTAVIQGVPEGVSDAELREWCSHYGSGARAEGGLEPIGMCAGTPGALPRPAAIMPCDSQRPSASHPCRHRAPCLCSRGLLPHP